MTDMESVSRFPIPDEDISFPKWEKVMVERSDSDGIAIGFTIEILENTLATLRRMGCRFVRLQVKAADTQVRIDARDTECKLAISGVIMPAKIDD